MSSDLQTASGGRRTTRALFAGAFAGLYAFIFLPLWFVPVFLTLGAVAGLAAPTMRRAYLRRRRDPAPTSGDPAPLR